MADGDVLSFELFLKHSKMCESLLHNNGPSLLLRLTIDPQRRDESVSSCEIEVSHIQRLSTNTEQQKKLNCDWSSWENIGIKHPQVCAILEPDDITAKAAIGMMALLIFKLEQFEIEKVLPRGTGADYEVGVFEKREYFPTEVSGLRTARFPSDSSGRLDEKRVRLLGKNRCGFVSVTTFAHPESGLHSYLHFVARPNFMGMSQEAAMTTHPRLNPEREASILSMDGETALYSADNALARDKHSRAAKILQKHANGAGTSAERHMLRFLAATQYFKAGFYLRALRLVRRIEPRFLSEHDKQLFQNFRNEVRRRTNPKYVESILKRVQHYQQKNEFKQVAALAWHHPYVFDRIALAYIRAYTSVRSKEYFAAGTFAYAADRFGLKNYPTKIIELAFLPCVAEFSEGTEEGWLAAKDFTRYWPHPMAYLVASSILYRLANSTKGETRREWAKKQTEYYRKADIDYLKLPIEYQNDGDVRLFLFTCAATAAIAYSWLQKHDAASKCLVEAESLRHEYKQNPELISGIRDLVNSSREKDLIDVEPPTVPNQGKKFADRARKEADDQVTPAFKT